MILRLLLPVFFIFSATAQIQDLSKTFLPLKSKGPLPAEFITNVRDVISQDITDMKKRQESDRGLKSSFVTASNYQIDRLLRSGNALVNDEVTNYVNEVADGLLKSDPTLRKKLKIYTLKSSVVNAYSYDKGYVFINIGLLAQLESEAQLAFVLAHEICHYTQQHHINGFVRNTRIDKGRSNGNTEEKYIEKCQYSKENESEADLEGFKIYEKTNYDLKQAEKGFSVLQYSHLPFELEPIKKEFFEGPDYRLPADYFLKEFNAIKDNSNEDDSRMTHPNTYKRRKAFADLIENRSAEPRVKEVLGKERFEYIRDLCRMEICRLFLKERDYPNAFYSAYILSQKYPANQYVLEMISKALYGIALYQQGEIRYTEDSHLSYGMPHAAKVESYPQQIYYMMENMSAHEWTVMALNKVYRYHRSYPQNRELTVLSDSLFHLLDRTYWSSNFIRKKTAPVADTAVKASAGSKTDLIASLQETQKSTVVDTAYYRNVFLDLFTEDAEFVKKFPVAHRQPMGQRSYNSGQRTNSESDVDSYYYIPLQNKKAIDTLIVLEPFYFRVDQRKRDAVNYLSTDKKQESFMNAIERSSSRLKIKLEKLDPGLLGPEDAIKMNDLSIVNDWFEERFDSELQQRVILNTNEIDAIIHKYNTPYVLRTGVVSVVYRLGIKRTYFYGFVYDMQRNTMLYRRYEVFRRRDKDDLLRSKTYQMLQDLRKAKKGEY